MAQNQNLENSMLQYEKHLWVPVYILRLFSKCEEKKNQ